MEDNKFQREVLDRLIVLETLIKDQDWKSVKTRSDEAYNTSINNEKRIDALEDTNKWLWRCVAGILIASAIAIVFNL